MKNILSVFILLAAVIGSRESFAQDENKPLDRDEGYLFVAIKMERIAVRTISIDGGGSMFYATDFLRKDLKPGINYKIVKLPAGEYYWRKVQMENRNYFNFDDDRFPFTVKAGQINYAGLFMGKAVGGHSAEFTLKNQATAAIEYLESCCEALTEKYPVRYGGNSEDPFLSYYFSLPEGDIAADDSEVGGKTIGDLIEEMPSESVAAPLLDALAEEFLRGNKYELPRISPNGELVSTLERVDGFLELVVIDPVNRRKMRIISEQTGAGSPNLDFNEVNWVDNEHIAFEFTISKLDRMGLARIIFDDGGLPVDVEVSLLGDNWYILDPLPHIAKKAMVMSVNEGRRTLEAIDVTDPKSAFKGTTTSKLQSKFRDTVSWLMDRSGRVRIAIEVDHEKLEKILWFRREDSLNWRKMWVGDPNVTIVPVMVEPDDRTVVVISNENTDNAILLKYDRVDKAYGDVVLDLPGRDIESVLLDASKSEVIRVSYTEQGITKHQYIGDKYNSLAEMLDPETYGSSPYIVDFSVGEKFAVIRTTTNDDPGAYYLFDIDNKLSYRFGSLRPWLSKFRLGASRSIETVTADGLNIESYLTVPDAESYPTPPLIVMPHGGPISVRDTQHFNDAVQLLSAMGYAVLQTNYRGSSGFGKSFEAKGEGQWGRQIEDDIEAAVRSILNLDIVDQDRICVFGSSYGGYSALISAIRRPDLYKCAASFAGVADMTLIFHEFRVNQSNLIRKVLQRIVGDPNEEIDTLVEYSPLYNADKINIPIFLSHGMKDDVVDMEHYYRMKLVLERFNKDAEYLVFPTEAHGFEYLSTEVKFYGRLDQFLRRAMDLPPVSLEEVLKANATWPEVGDSDS